ncbi:hypothetical protein ACFY36_01880 [Actinoplanes sp. NPDC000266]
MAAVAAGVFDGVEQMELPRLNGPAFDQILSGGRPVGVSTGRALSLTVGATQRPIRAVVTALPFKSDRRRTDVASL